MKEKPASQADPSVAPLAIAKMVGGTADIDSRLFVNSLEKGFLVLHAFREDRTDLSIAEIAAATGLDRSAAQRFTYTLHKLGYLRRDRVSRLYALTPKVLELASGYLRSDMLAEQSVRYLAEFVEETGEPATLTELDNLQIVVLARAPGRHLFTVNTVLGMRFDAYCSSPGRAMMAHLEEAEVRDILERSTRRHVTPHTVTDMDSLTRLVAQARIDGFATADQELVMGAMSIAAPIIDAAGRPRAAINTFCPIARWTRERVRRELVPHLLDKARRLAADIRGA